jgi:hypothetical protein
VSDGGGLRVVEENGLRLVEGPPEQRLMLVADDAARVVEACLSESVNAALLYAPNLTERFFDLSSGDAGTVLQKLRNYRLRLAVVCPPGSVRFSSRFSEVVAEERRGPWFGVFDTREAALAWLARDAAT